MSRKNLIFIMTDHQRADSIGMVQSNVEVTPNLNRLAERGTHFTRAYTTCPLCVPARTALATGKYPTQTGVVYNDWSAETAQNHTPLHQMLYENGYRVAHIGVDHVQLRPTLRERVSFAKWSSKAEYAEYCRQQGIIADKSAIRPFRTEILENQNGVRRKMFFSNTTTGVWPGAVPDFLDMFYCREAIDFLNHESDSPFTLFLYLWAPHPPLRVPEPFASLFDPAEIDLPENMGQPGAGEPAGRRASTPAQLAAGVSEAEWRKVWAAHLGLVHLADRGIGKVLAALETTNQAHDTVVLFTGDHGDHLGQHALYQKMEMYEPALNIPLIISGPGIRHTRQTEPVSHLDILPTLLDLFEMPVPPDIDGFSLAPALVQQKPVPPHPVFAQYSGGSTLGDTRRCVISGKFKYVFTPEDTPELFDLKNDPLEMTNLASHPAYLKTRQDLHSLLENWGRTHSDCLF